MDVQCERCKTEYEFDDALVSGRGTTVKCTNCGHQFKIRRDGGEEDRWVVTGRAGEQIYRSLRELQKAILARQVSPSDTLVRGSLRRELGAIAELVPFFEERRRSSRPPPPGPEERKASSRPPPPPNATPAPPLAPPARSRFSTTHGFPPPPAPLASGMTPSPIPPAPGKRPSVRAIPASSPIPPPMRQPAATQDFGPEPDTMRMALRSTLDDDEPATHPNPPAPLPAPGPARSQAPVEPPPYAPPPYASPHASEPPAARSAPPEPLAIVTATPPPPVVAPRTPPPPRVVSQPPVSLPERSVPLETSSPLPPPTAPVRSPAIYDDDAPSQDLPPVSHRRRPVGGFVVALVVVLALGGFGAYWAKQNLLAKPPTATTDPRVAEFVAAGEKALAEGNLDLAKENYDKASTLAEKDQRVLVGAARLAAMRADTMWLKSRLLPPDATDDQRATRDALSDLTQRARRAADDAVAAAPDDPAALRAKIDALRIAGDRDGARALVGKVIGSAAQPETAYVLAALDLAEPEPLWSSVLERLRLAAGAEQGPGRGRALLVYALARAGEVTQARGELDRLQSVRPHPLARELKAFVAKATPRPVVAGDGGLALAGDGGAIDVGSLPLAGSSGTGGPAVMAGDPKQLVSAGEAARQKGDFEKARMLYSAALDKNPNDSEALNGLAEIAHASHDLAGARNSYRRVLGINPSYLPALIGLADVEWESGDVAGAQRAYKDIVDRFPEGSYPARVKQRAEPQGTAPTPSATSAPSSAPTTAPTPTTPTPAPTEEKP